MLTGKSLSVSPYLGGIEHGINGNSTKKDFETALQILYLMFTEPRFDQDEYDNGINQIKAVLPNLVQQPNYKLQTELFKVLYGDNPRRRMISQEILDGIPAGSKAICTHIGCFQHCGRIKSHSSIKDKTYLAVILCYFLDGLTHQFPAVGVCRIECGGRR